MSDQPFIDLFGHPVIEPLTGRQRELPIGPVAGSDADRLEQEFRSHQTPNDPHTGLLFERDLPMPPNHDDFEAAVALNADRANDAREALRHFASHVNKLKVHDDELPEYLTDLLADLMHMCNLDGLDFDDTVRIARDHFQAELAEAKGGGK